MARMRDFDRDLVRHAALRVAAAVRALVVRGNPVGHFLEAGNAGDDVVGVHRVQAEDVQLLDAEDARLRHDPLGNRELTDVVQQGGKTKLLEAGLRQSDALAQALRRSGRRGRRRRP